MTDIRLSASAIDDYLKCGRMYWYRRFHPEESVDSVEIIVGRVVHEAIEKFWRDRSLALEFIDKTLIEGKTKAINSINGFFDNYVHLLNEGDQIEQFFSVPYSKGVSLIGKFDRITQPNILYDWKTSATHPFTLSNSPQFILYYFAYTQLYKSEPSLYYAGLDGKLIKYKHDSELSYLFIREIIPDVLDGIKSGRFFPSGLYKYNTCGRCLYKQHCHETLLKKE